MLGMVAAFAIAPATDTTGVMQRMVSQQLPLPAVNVLATDNRLFPREEPVRGGDTVVSLLGRLGITDREALRFIRSDRQAQSLIQQLRPGLVVSAQSAANGELDTLQVPIAGQDAMLVVERRGGGFVAHQQALEYEVRTVISSAEFRASLFATADSAGIPEAITLQLIEVFGSEIDLYRDLRKGGRLSLVYETFTHRGQTVRSGRILAAEVRSQRKVWQVYWFQPEHGAGAYYNADGRSLNQAFLLTPIEFSRITSGFSDERWHPILHTLRAHKGVDYAAPTGTRVIAAADGVVEAAEYQNNGYGNLVVLKHQGPYSSAYAHLNDFAPGLARGTRVRQGDTIGSVGQTGLATGPHLHYEFRINDEQVDPQTISPPAPIPLEGKQLARYKESRKALQAQLELAREVTLAELE